MKVVSQLHFPQTTSQAGTAMLSVAAFHYSHVPLTFVEDLPAT